MTDEQLEKAKVALRDAKMQALQKRVALRIYRQCQKTAERLQLPFRMVHKAEYPAGEIVPSIFYPLPCSIGKRPDGSLYTLPDAREITAEDAIYYFTRLLVWNADNLRSYAPTDWTGNPTTPAEAEQLKRGYFERIQAYKAEPELFDHEAHPLPPDAKERYFLPDVIS